VSSEEHTYLKEKKMNAEHQEARAVIGQLPAEHARRLAVDTLLAQPEELGDDVLGGCLYELRERLAET
jgi:hypothetical protein